MGFVALNVLFVSLEDITTHLNKNEGWKQTKETYLDRLSDWETSILITGHTT